MRPEEIRGLFQNAADFEEHTVEACGKRLTAFFIDGLTSGGDIAELVLRPLRENLRADGRQTLLEQAETGAVWCASVSRAKDAAAAAEKLVNGFCVVVFPGEAEALCFETKTGEKRAPSAPEVEPAREDDLDEIFDCAQRFVADCGLLDKPEKESFRKVLDSIRVIRADGKIVSMARIAPATGDDLRLALVYTRDEYRGKGYARKVVNSAKNEILASGKRVTLNVDRKNPVSYHLYLSLGFERMFSQGEFRRVE